MKKSKISKKNINLKKFKTLNSQKDKFLKKDLFQTTSCKKNKIKNVNTFRKYYQRGGQFESSEKFFTPMINFYECLSSEEKKESFEKIKEIYLTFLSQLFELRKEKITSEILDKILTEKKKIVSLISDEEKDYFIDVKKKYLIFLLQLIALNYEKVTSNLLDNILDLYLSIGLKEPSPVGSAEASPVGSAAKNMKTDDISNLISDLLLNCKDKITDISIFKDSFDIFTEEDSNLDELIKLRSFITPPVQNLIDKKVFSEYQQILPYFEESSNWCTYLIDIFELKTKLFIFYVAHEFFKRIENQEKFDIIKDSLNTFASLLNTKIKSDIMEKNIHFPEIKENSQGYTYYSRLRNILNINTNLNKLCEYCIDTYSKIGNIEDFSKIENISEIENLVRINRILKSYKLNDYTSYYEYYQLSIEVKKVPTKDINDFRSELSSDPNKIQLNIDPNKTQLNIGNFFKSKISPYKLKIDLNNKYIEITNDKDNFLIYLNKIKNVVKINNEKYVAIEYTDLYKDKSSPEKDHVLIFENSVVKIDNIKLYQYLQNLFEGTYYLESQEEKKLLLSDLYSNVYRPKVNQYAYNDQDAFKNFIRSYINNPMIPGVIKKIINQNIDKIIIFKHNDLNYYPNLVIEQKLCQEDLHLILSIHLR